MYKIQEIPKETLAEFKVPQKLQAQLVEQKIAPFDPLAAYDLLKKETMNFKERIPLAEEADALFYAMFYPEPQTQSQEKKTNKLSIEMLQLKEKERARALALLALELELDLEVS